MNRKPVSVNFPDIDPKHSFLIFIFFAAGSLLGLLSMKYIDYDFSASLVYDVINYDFGMILNSLSHFKLHILVFIFGFSVFGFLFVPFISLIKGFTLSFVSSCIFYFSGQAFLSPLFIRFFLFELIITLFLFFIMSNAFRCSVVFFKSLFISNYLFRRDLIIKSVLLSVYSFIILLILYFLFYFLF